MFVEQPTLKLILSLQRATAFSGLIVVQVSLRDITQKGYEKKRAKLLAPYMPARSTGAASPSTRAKKELSEDLLEMKVGIIQRSDRKLSNKHLLQCKIGQNRQSQCHRSEHQLWLLHHSSSDDDSAVNEGSTPEQEHLPTHNIHQATTSQSDTSSTSSTRETPSPQQWYNGRPNRVDDYWVHTSCASPMTNLADVMQNLTPSLSVQPDVTNTSAEVTRWTSADHVNRPKRRPLPEFYVDDESDLETKQLDPNAPRPEGNLMTPITGEELLVPSGLPLTSEAAIKDMGQEL
ncbi:disco-interacting protein 2 [Caerostris extrusa]|uniref:Disco-interacting protein 2 n=1 Tax=Caerostris extrusa TaxID=172846 RepID=A0AAV4RNM2_CAEEX|nr:disco-interacting protein 2 [Caerostris extrusa]